MLAQQRGSLIYCWGWPNKLACQSELTTTDFENIDLVKE